MRLFQKILIATVILTALASTVVPARAARQMLGLSRQASRYSFQGQSGGQSQVKMQARAGFGDDGSYLMGAWFPVRVTLDNPAGGQNMKVRLEVSLLGDEGSSGPGGQVGVYARDVDLPSPSRKQVMLYAYSGGFVHSMDVRMMQGETQVAKTTVNLDPIDPSNAAIVGVVSSDAALLNVYKGEPVGHPEVPPYSKNYGGPPQQGSSQPARATIVHMSLDDIPTLSNTLDSLEALFIDDVDTGTLTQEQRDALAAWVGRGGTLTVSSRPGGPDALSGLADISPVTATGTRTLTRMQGLADFVAVPITPTGATIVSDAKLRTDAATGARLLAAEGGVPLVAMRDLGGGQVAYLGVSPGVAPVKNWDGLVPLVRRLLAEHALQSVSGGKGFGRSSGPPQGQLFNLYGSIFDLPSLDLPEPLLIGLFMLVYIILIGPVNYLVLKRMRRAELAWLTIPAMVAVFSIGAYIIGFQSKGGELLTIRGNVMHTEAGLKQVEARQYLGLFSPTRRIYRIQLGADAIATEIDAYSNYGNGYGYGGGGGGGNQSAKPPVVVGGPTTTLENINVNTWSLRAFTAQSAVQMASPLQTDLHLGDNVIEGTVRNAGNTPMQDVALVRGRAVQYIGALAPGQTAPVKLSISNQAFDPGSPVAVMPPPQGVQDPTGNNNNYGYNSGRVSNEQRMYNRRVQMLQTALTPLLWDAPPADLSVLSLAWGPTPSANFTVLDHTSRTDDMNVWTGRHIVTAGGDGAKAKLNSGLVPSSVYAPSATPAWSVPTSSNFTLNPYSDLSYRLPAGTQPRSLTIKYDVAAGSESKQVEVLGYNVQSGIWDRLIAMDGGSQPHKADFSIPSPADYVSPDGSVALRFASTEGTNTADISFSSFDLTLNDGQ